jgi:transcription initiation factor TFIIIB Brf1 subunit/transcription initiation factor TFIIB
MKLNSPKCPRCEFQEFTTEVITLKGVSGNSQAEVIICAKCGAVISSLPSFDHDQSEAVLDKLDIAH